MPSSYSLNFTLLFLTLPPPFHTCPSRGTREVGIGLWSIHNASFLLLLPLLFQLLQTGLSPLTAVLPELCMACSLFLSGTNPSTWVLSGLQLWPGTRFCPLHMEMHSVWCPWATGGQPAPPKALCGLQEAAALHLEHLLSPSALTLGAVGLLLSSWFPHPSLLSHSSSCVMVFTLS